MGVTHSTTGNTPTVFNVNIVTPTETEKPPVIQKITPLKRKFIPPIIRRRRRPLPKNIMPDTMYGKGTSTDTKENDNTSDSKSSSIVPPSTLFDKKTIEKFAKKGSSASKGLTFDTSGFKHRGYMRMLKERIESLWKYPKDAARSRHSGDLHIKFTIKRDGTLGNVNLLKTSGYNSLDEAAMKALEKASPYWPLPEDWEGDTLEITGHFIYIYGITHVM